MWAAHRSRSDPFSSSSTPDALRGLALRGSGEPGDRCQDVGGQRGGDALSGGFVVSCEPSEGRKSCKHIDGIHADLDRVPANQRGPRGYEPTYADGMAAEDVTIEAKWYCVLGSNGERYLVSWMAHGEDAAEFAKERDEKLKALEPESSRDDHGEESDPDDW